MELLTQLKEEATGDYIDTLLKLGELVTIFLTYEFLKEKPILPINVEAAQTENAIK